MLDYQKGKIYQIWSPNTDKVYIGSTVQALHKRMYDHKTTLTGKRYTTAREVLKCGEARIELIEDYPCAKKSELNRREGQIMRGYDNRVNKNIAGRTIAEWYTDNREVIKAKERERKAKPEVKARRAEQTKAYLARPEVKARRAEQTKAYRARPEVKARIAEELKAYEARPEVKARRAAQKKEYYQQKKEHLEAYQQAYHQRPEVKARRAAQARERYWRKKAEQQQTASA